MQDGRDGADAQPNEDKTSVLPDGLGAEHQPQLEKTVEEPAQIGTQAEAPSQPWIEASKKPLQVDCLFIDGLKRTDPSIVLNEFNAVSTKGPNLEDIKDALLELHDNLLDLGIFDTVEIVIDAGSKPNTCNVRLKCKERGSFGWKAATYFQGGEGTVELAVTALNALGLAESAQAKVEWGSKASSEVQVEVGKPHVAVAGRRLNLGLGLGQRFRSALHYASYTELVRGGHVALSSLDGSHTVAYELGWRFLQPHLASRAVREAGGHSLKSAVRYSFRHSTFDDAVTPTSGYTLSTTTELAGLGPDPKLQRHAKQSLSAGWATALGASARLHLQADAGLLMPWGPRFWEATTSLSDRFLLGGANLRGFRQNGVGPVDHRPLPVPPGGGAEQELAATPRGDRGLVDFLGGDVYLSVLAALRFDVPHPVCRQAGIQGQLFLNGGGLTLLSGQRHQPFQRGLEEFARDFRWTAGVGLVWPTFMGNLEINYCRVLRHRQETDLVRHGFSIGFVPRL